MSNGIDNRAYGQAWPLTVSLLIAASVYSTPTFAQNEEVLTFKGTGGSSIKIIDSKGKIKEEVKEDQLKKITIAPKWSVPKQLSDPEPEEKITSNAARSKRKPGETSKNIDKMLKERRKIIRTSTIRARRPPKKRK